MKKSSTFSKAIKHTNSHCSLEKSKFAQKLENDNLALSTLSFKSKYPFNVIAFSNS